MLRNNQPPMTRFTEETDDIPCDSDFPRIEELIKGNTFSREEIAHLIEILNSREGHNWEKQTSSGKAEVDTQLVSWTNEIQGTPSEEKQNEIDRNMIRTFHGKSDVPVEISASPIDIARAYMAGRTSGGGHDLHNFILKGERAQPSREFAENPLLPSPSPKPSVCWPGAVVHDHHGYTTPQSQRGRHRLHDFPRTPYSRTILSKSTTKVQADSGYTTTPAPFQQTQTSIYGQVKSRGDNIDGYGSVGPIRRIRNKFASEARPRGTIFQGSLKATPSKIGMPKASGGFLPNNPKNLEQGETSGTSKSWSETILSDSSNKIVSNPNLSSSEAVRKILEHLDRSKPTPKQKEAELRLATAWRRSSPTEAPDSIREENISSVCSGELASLKNTDIALSNFPEFNNGPSKSNFLEKFHYKGNGEAKGAVNGISQTPSSLFTGTRTTPGSNAMPSFGVEGTSDAPVKISNESGATLHFSRSPPSNGQGAEMSVAPTGLEISKTQGTKPSLPSIFINKPTFAAVSSDNRPSFTFPVSASSGVLSELPTPSIIPSSSASILSQPIGVPTIPSYTFRTNKSTPTLVFSFPSTSSVASVEDSDLKFSFGSDKKTRLSFSSFEKDAICY